MVRWDCGFTYESYLLCAQYLALIVIFVVYISRLCYIPKRRAQKSFLVLGLLQCVARALYFALWPPLYQMPGHCAPRTTGEEDTDSFLMTALGTFAPALFLSAFAVSVYTTARIYHTRMHRHNLRAFYWVTSIIGFTIASTHILVLLNLLSVGSEEIRHKIDVGSALAISATSLIVALGFLVYSFLLHRDFRRKQLESYYATHAPATSQTGYPIRHRGSDEVMRATGGLTNVDAQQLPPNPMRKLLVTSSLCMLCFLCRTVILPVIVVRFKGEYPTPWVFLYLWISEIVPASLMLYIFESRPAVKEGYQQIEDGSTQPSDPLLPHDLSSVSPVRQPSLTYDRSMTGTDRPVYAPQTSTVYHAVGSNSNGNRVMHMGRSSPTTYSSLSRPSERSTSNFASSVTPGADRVRDMMENIFPSSGSGSSPNNSFEGSLQHDHFSS